MHWHKRLPDSGQARHFMAATLSCSFISPCGTTAKVAAGHGIQLYVTIMPVAHRQLYNGQICPNIGLATHLADELFQRL